MKNDRFNAPRRKPTRLKEFDYSSNGAYFITMRINEINEALSIITKGKLSLLKNGEIIENELNKINEMKDFNICKYVIMPDHIHFILIVNNQTEKEKAKKKICQVICGFKSITTKLINKQEDIIGRKIWQRSFHDHIIRNDEDFQIKYKYIHHNPMCWYIKNFIDEED